MSAIAFCLDLILASLLMAALYVGLRLDKRLKALRESHAGFAGAVAELDAAVVKAQDGLATLKATAAQVETAIADRIQDARGMTAKLDQQSAAAKTAAEKLERLLERYPSSTALPITAHPRESGDPGFLALREKIAAARAPGQPLAREALSRPASAQEKSPGPRFRGDERSVRPGTRADDDELFEIIEPVLRAARGSGR
jgi:hypothetical protein